MWIDGILYCSDCASENCVPYPKAGPNAYKCLDCGNIMPNPPVINATMPETV
jgi:ribosomal protein S27E